MEHIESEGFFSLLSTLEDTKNSDKEKCIAHSDANIALKFPFRFSDGIDKQRRKKSCGHPYRMRLNMSEISVDQKHENEIEVEKKRKIQHLGSQFRHPYYRRNVKNNISKSTNGFISKVDIAPYEYENETPNVVNNAKCNSQHVTQKKCDIIQSYGNQNPDNFTNLSYPQNGYHSHVQTNTEKLDRCYDKRYRNQHRDNYLNSEKYNGNSYRAQSGYEKTNRLNRNKRRSDPRVNDINEHNNMIQNSKSCDSVSSICVKVSYKKRCHTFPFK